MKKTKDKYFVKIKHEFLFDIYNKFKSEYTPWVYLFLKFKHNYYLQNNLKVWDKIYSSEIIHYFGVNKTTIYKCLKELELNGLLEKKGNKIRLIDENIYLVTNAMNETQLTDKYNRPIKNIKFLAIGNNDFNKLVIDIKNQIFEFRGKHHTLVRTLKVFYYLVSKNRQALWNNKKHLTESKENQSSLSKDLKHDHRYIKMILTILKDAGYLILDDEVKIATIDKKIYNPDYVNKKILENQNLNNGIEEIKYVEYDTVRSNFLGYTKSDDGKQIYLLYIDNNNHVVKKDWCKGKGIKITNDERKEFYFLNKDKQNSEYYNPENFWKHAKIKQVQKENEWV